MSPLAGMLNFAGIDLGDDLTPGHKDNPKGFFEHDEIWQIHDQLLRETGSSWNDIRKLQPHWQQSPAADQARDRLGALLEQDFTSKPLWGIKDPRLSRLFGIWPELLDGLGAEARVILAVRHPMEVAVSLTQRDGLDPAHGLALWLRYTLDAERNTRGLKRAAQYYPNLIEDWRAELARLVAVLDLPLLEPTAQTSAAIDGFLDSGLRHHCAGADWADYPQPLAGWCAQVYDAMLTLPGAGALHTLDAIREAFDSSELQAAAYAAQISDHLRKMELYRNANQWLESERTAQTAVAAAAAETATAEQARLTSELERRAENTARHLPAPEPLDDDTDVLTVPQDAVAEDYRPPAVVSVSLEPGAQHSPRQNIFPNLRVVIVTPDIHGPIRNGGIGTAFAALAQQLAAWGADITIAYALGTHSENEPASYWQKHYADLGVKFLALTETQLQTVPSINAPHVRQLPWRVYRWLERNEKSFDLAIFPEWMGLAYYALIAKGQGLAFKNLVIAVNAHSPESWASEGNKVLPNYLDLIDRDFMERECVRRADWVISPSRYMIDWMRGRKWEVPDRVRIIQNLMPDTMGPLAGITPAQKSETLVFFGRLEFRKGLKLFCDAIDRLPPAQRNKLRAVKFLGKAVVQGGFDSRRYIADRTRNWGIRVDVVTDKNKDQALVELSQPGVLAVIASLSENSPYTVLECLHHGVRFVASRVGGITELVHPEDTESCLFVPNPQSLANCLENAMTHGFSVARMAQPQSGTREQWQSWFQEVVQTRSAHVARADASAEKPLVSICLVHHNRPQYLAQSLESLRTQSYPNIEVVLVDDGSPSAEAQQALTGLEPEFRSRGWQLIRQANSYLGAARNRAAEAARGQYLMFMDDDNIAMPHEVETFVSAALHGGADILTCASALFDEKPKKDPSNIWLPLGGAAGAGMYRNVFGDANAFWKRDVYLALGGHTTDYGVGHEDWELFAEAVLSGARLEVVPMPLFWYRVNTNGMLRSGDTWMDHARSARAYLRRDPGGLGMASAYAVFLKTSEEHEAFRPANMGGKRWRRIWRALLRARDPSLRAQFIGVWRHQGFHIAVTRALKKANR